MSIGSLTSFAAAAADARMRKNDGAIQSIQVGGVKADLRELRLQEVRQTPTPGNHVLEPKRAPFRQTTQEEGKTHPETDRKTFRDSTDSGIRR